MATRKLVKGFVYFFLCLVIAGIGIVVAAEVQVRLKAIPVTEESLRAELGRAQTRSDVEHILKQYKGDWNWYPKEQTLRCFLRNTEGTGFLFKVNLGVQVTFDNQGRIVAIDVKRSTTTL